MRIAVLACLLFLTGCASAIEGPQVAVLDSESIIPIYDVAPSNAINLGPVTRSTCGGTGDLAKKRLLTAARNQGANGVTQLKCTDEGLSFYCWTTPKCEAIALNIPPPPPPKPVPPPAKPRKRR